MKNQALIGSIQPILAEGFSKKQLSGSLDHLYHAVQWTGRTSTNKIVHFYQNDNPDGCGSIIAGKLVHVKIERAYSHSLWGKPVDIEFTAEGLKGEKSYAA